MLILTCTGVYFSHGSNDGQKGMGLIMLILIGAVPTAYALNRAMPDKPDASCSHRASAGGEQVIEQNASAASVIGDPRPAVTEYVRAPCRRGHFSLARRLVGDISDQVRKYGSIAKVPAAAGRQHAQRHVPGLEAIRCLMKDKVKRSRRRTSRRLNAYKRSLDAATKFIPTWVKVAVAIALGLGTMVGWKRIVVTVGEKSARRTLPTRRARAPKCRRGDHRRRRHVRAAGFHHPRAVVRRCRHHGGERFRFAAVDGAQYRAGLGADLAGGDDDFRLPLLGVRVDLLSGRRTGNHPTTRAPEQSGALILFFVQPTTIAIIALEDEQ